MGRSGENRVDYDLTLHAGDALEKRQIQKKWMEQVLGEPEWTEIDPFDVDLEHRLGRIVDFDNRVLRVIVNIKVSPPRVVTVYFDRRRIAP